MINILKQNYGLDHLTDNEIIQGIKQDYEDLIDLRNRIKDGTDNDTILYEEDHITLDHVLDYMEIMMKKERINIDD